jgi:serine/threonine protein kinase
LLRIIEMQLIDFAISLHMVCHLCSAAGVGLGRLLGRGSVGSVYEGSLHDMPVAVKVAHQKTHPAPEEYSAAEAEQHLQHEVAAYSRLAPVQGKFVPRLMASGTLMSDAGEPFPFLATSLVGNGLPLCEAAAQLQPSQLAPVARAAMAAVTAIHCLGVAHGDVRSPNVLLDVDGSVKLVDFSEAELQPQSQQCEGDVASMRSVLTTMAQQCLGVSREHAAVVVQQWLSDTGTS